MATRSSTRLRKGVDIKKKSFELAKVSCQSYGDPPGFEVKVIDDYIGEGVFATKAFSEGEFLLEYKGDLISSFKHATQLEKEYAEADLGCFMYFFKCRNKTMCIDATNDIFGQGRMVNDAENGDILQNCVLNVVLVDGSPHLCIFCTRDIAKGEELRYDYGVPNLPWRQKNKRKLKGHVKCDDKAGVPSEEPGPESTHDQSVVDSSNEEEADELEQMESEDNGGIPSEEQFSESVQNMGAIDYLSEEEADQTGIPSTCKKVRDAPEDMDTHECDDMADHDNDANYEPESSDNDSEDEPSSDEDIETNSGGSSDGKTHVNETYSRLMTNVTIPSYMGKEGGKRDYRKTNYCLFCKHPFTSKISSHYISIHSSEEKVKSAILHPVKSKERKTALLEIENRGNFKHNVAVIEKGEGELIVARRPSCKSKNKYTAADFLPCEFCLGFYMKDTLWLHINKCPLKPKKKQPSANYIRNAKIMLTPFMPDITEEEANLETFFNGMKETTANPGIPVVCRNDTLIREFAKSMLYRLGDKSEQRVKDIDNVRTKVRTIGRLLNELNGNTDIARPLSDFITGRNFSRVIDSTKAMHLKLTRLRLHLH